MEIDRFEGHDWPIITPADSPDLIHAALRHLPRVKWLNPRMRDTVDYTLGRLGRHFDLSPHDSEPRREIDPGDVGVTIYMMVDDLEQAVVGLRNFMLDRQPGEAEPSSITRVDDLLVGFEKFRARSAT